MKIIKYNKIVNFLFEKAIYVANEGKYVEYV